MTPDQITAWGAILVAIISAATTAIYRWTSKAGRAIRKLRRALEASIEYNYALRRAALRHGVPRRSLPRVPQALIDLDVYTPTDVGPDVEPDGEDELR